MTTTPKRVEIEATDDGIDGVQVHLVVPMEPGAVVHISHANAIVTFYASTAYDMRTLAQNLAGVVDTLADAATVMERASNERAAANGWGTPLAVGEAAASAPVLTAIGSETNIDPCTYRPRGAGVLKVGEAAGWPEATARAQERTT